jgi:hypothetical protein
MEKQYKIFTPQNTFDIVYNKFTNCSPTALIQSVDRFILETVVPHKFSAFLYRVSKKDVPEFSNLLCEI